MLFVMDDIFRVADGNTFEKWEKGLGTGDVYLNDHNTKGFGLKTIGSMYCVISRCLLKFDIQSYAQLWPLIKNDP